MQYKLIWVLLVPVLCHLAWGQYSYRDTFEDDEEDSDEARALRAITRQFMLMQLENEEKARSSGDSGVKQIRGNAAGTRQYHAEGHTGNSFLAMHNHANNWRTIGLGEFIATLNGVEFRTRHNDYALVMPSTDNSDYHATENIPFPEVPPSVLEEPDIDSQIVEMRKYFEAFAKQDESIREYKDYFKAVLCYLEGAWTESAGDIDESFPSDRHWIDAKTWYELQEKIMYTGYTGTKDGDENYAYLPVKVVGMNGSFPITAQWNYRILCHPLSNDLPLERFRLYDDLQARMKTGMTIDDYANNRMARFQINPRRNSNDWTEGNIRPQTLDEMFAEIPGWDNYAANLTDESFGNLAMSIFDDSEVQNAGYYHRFFRSLQNDAMGVSVRSRGYADANLFVAMNTQNKTVGMTLTSCEGGEHLDRWQYRTPPADEEHGGYVHTFWITREKLDNLRSGAEYIYCEVANVNDHRHVLRLKGIWNEDESDIEAVEVNACKDWWDDEEWNEECWDGHKGIILLDGHVEKCEEYHQKVSYAIPLEIIYMTPLSVWNPYNIEHFEGNNNKPTEGGANGNNPDRALLGASNNRHYLTPAEFYEGGEIDDDPADTSGGNIWVLDSEGEPRAVRSAGHYIFLPQIEGIGSIRQRYPIAPLTGEGEVVWKELEALKDIVLKPVTYKHMFHEDYREDPTPPPPTHWDFYTPPSYVEFESHEHLVTITKEKMDLLLGGQNDIWVNSEEMNGHIHHFRVSANWDELGEEIESLSIFKCRNNNDDPWENECWDGHAGILSPAQ